MRVFKCILSFGLFCLGIVGTVRAVEPSDSTKANNFLEQGKAAMDHSQMDSALEMFSKSAEISALIKDYDKWCQGLNWQAKVLTTQMHFPKAIAILDSSLFISKRFLDQPHPRSAQAYNNLGYCFQAIGKPVEGLESLEMALRMRLSMFGRVHADVGQTYFIIGTFYGRQGLFEKEKVYLDTALAIKLEVFGEGHPELVQTYNNLGVWNSGQGDFAAAQEYYEQSLEILHTRFGPDYFGLASLYNNLANMMIHRGSPQKGLVYLQKARRLNEQNVPGSVSLAVNLMNIGECRMRLGQVDEALRAFDNSLAIEEALMGKNYPPLGVTLMRKGRAQAAKGMREEALATLARAEQLIQSSQGWQQQRLGNVYASQAAIWFELGEVEKGIETFRKALSTTKEKVGPNHPHTAQTYFHFAEKLLEEGRADDCLHYAQEGLRNLLTKFQGTDLAEAPPTGTIHIWPHIRDLAMLKAQAFHEKSRLAREKLPLLKAAWANAQVAVALSDSIRIHFTDDASRSLLGENAFPYFETGVALCFELYQETGEQNYLESAFRIAEQSKAFLLSQSVQTDNAQQVGNLPDSLVKRERYLKASIAKYDERLHSPQAPESIRGIWDSIRFSLELEYEALQNHLELNFPEVYQYRFQTELISVSEAQADLQPDECLLEFFSGDSVFYRFTLTATGVDLDRISKSRELQSDIKHLRAAISQVPDPEKGRQENWEAFTQPAHRLYRNLIGEVLGNESIQRLSIVPDGALAQLPFDILLKKQAMDASHGYADLAYLFREVQVRYGYAARFLSGDRGPSIAKEELLAMAPSFGKSPNTEERTGLGALKYSGPEIQAVSAIFSGRSIEGDAATEGRFKAIAADFRMLHLASHLVLNDSIPMASRLIFSGEKDSLEDGELHLYELYDLDIQAELAVLSACNTGAGKFQRGEGQLSLAWGFRMAGCPSILVSLWNANDQATSELMTYFYEGLAEGNSKPQALNTAREKYLANADLYRSHPYFWSGFVLIGDPASISTASPGWGYWWYAALGVLALAIGIWAWRRKRQA